MAIGQIVSVHRDDVGSWSLAADGGPEKDGQYILVGDRVGDRSGCRMGEIWALVGSSINSDGPKGTRTMGFLLPGSLLEMLPRPESLPQLRATKWLWKSLPAG